MQNSSFCRCLERGLRCKERSVRQQDGLQAVTLKVAASQTTSRKPVSTHGKHRAKAGRIAHLHRSVRSNRTRTIVGVVAQPSNMRDEHRRLERSGVLSLEEVVPAIDLLGSVTKLGRRVGLRESHDGMQEIACVERQTVDLVQRGLTLIDEVRRRLWNADPVVQVFPDRRCQHPPSIAFAASRKGAPAVVHHLEQASADRSVITGRPASPRHLTHRRFSRHSIVGANRSRSP